LEGNGTVAALQWAPVVEARRRLQVQREGEKETKKEVVKAARDKDDLISVSLGSGRLRRTDHGRRSRAPSRALP